MWKKCEWCNKEFYRISPAQRFCSKKCRKISYSCKQSKSNEICSRKKEKQLCWTCQRATGYCSWSRNFKPIKGWDAKIVTVEEEGTRAFRTYCIKKCPLYLKDVKR